MRAPIITTVVTSYSLLACMSLCAHAHVHKRTRSFQTVCSLQPEQRCQPGLRQSWTGPGGSRRPTLFSVPKLQHRQTLEARFPKRQGAHCPGKQELRPRIKARLHPGHLLPPPRDTQSCLFESLSSLEAGRKGPATAGSLCYASALSSSPPVHTDEVSKIAIGGKMIFSVQVLFLEIGELGMKECKSCARPRKPCREPLGLTPEGIQAGRGEGGGEAATCSQAVRSAQR